ncbi:MAG: hypothetical protein KJO52_12480 [Maribacter sp.]|nr:hypothetical protein [Maribacter sp.]MBT8300509.1 hypothetical protein [Maribacter sp.]NNK17911.1 hypothetical protein [Maribacter sp.]
MKDFQRTVIAFIVCLVLVACQKEKNSQDVVTLNSNSDTEKMVEILPIRANIISAPNVASDSITCVFPDSFVFVTIPEFSSLTGNTSQFGKLDKSRSHLIVRECSLNIETQTVDLVLDMILRNKNGEGLKFLGALNVNIEGPTSGVFEVIAGYGKFRGFTGWITTEGFLNTDLGTLFLSADGMINQPNNEFRTYFARNEQ